MSALVLGVTVPAVGAPASASLPGSGDVLTSSNGQKSIMFHGDPSRTSLSSPEPVREAAWSPDGSQAVYLDQGGGISRLRYDDGAARYRVAWPDGVMLHSSPTWWGDGSRVAWAQKASADAPWRVAWQDSSGPVGNAWVSPNDGRHYLNPDGGSGPQLVLQRQNDNGAGQPSGPSAVMVYEISESIGRMRLVDENGSNPSISPDGSRVAFVREGRIVVSDMFGEDEVTVTPAGVRYDDPTWSPTGRTLAFSRVTATARPVYTAPADGSAAPAAVAGLDGVPAYQPRNRDRVARLSGTDRFTTAVTVSQSYWATAGTAGPDVHGRSGAGAVVLSRSDNYADALSGAALAAAKRGPLLLTPPTGLHPTTQAELQRVLPPGVHHPVYLLGSPGALSVTVENQVRALGYRVVRLAGPDRFSTSVAIAKEIDPEPDMVLLATGMNYPDALAAGAAAGAFNVQDHAQVAVLVLTNDEVLPPTTKAFLESLPREVTRLCGIGQQAGAAVYSYRPDDVMVRALSGRNRYETAHVVAEEFFGGQRYTGFATGTNWPDALTGGALMGALGGPLMLTPGSGANLGEPARALLAGSSGSVHTGLIFGSPDVVSASQQEQMGTWLGGPLGFDAVSNPVGLGR